MEAYDIRLRQTKMDGTCRNIPNIYLATISSDSVRRGTDEGRPFGMRQAVREREGGESQGREAVVGRLD